MGWEGLELNVRIKQNKTQLPQKQNRINDLATRGEDLSDGVAKTRKELGLLREGNGSRKKKK